MENNFIENSELFNDKKENLDNSLDNSEENKCKYII